MVLRAVLSGAKLNPKRLGGQKGVPVSGFRNMKGQGRSLVEVFERVGKSANPVGRN